MIERLHRGEISSNSVSTTGKPQVGDSVFLRDLQQCKQLVVGLEQTILKIDEALLEARLARETMLLYIQVRAYCCDATMH